MKTIIILIAALFFFNFASGQNLFEENTFEKFTSIEYTNPSGKTYKILGYNNVKILNGESEQGNEILDDLYTNSETTSMVYTRSDGTTYRTNNMRTWLKLNENNSNQAIENNSKISNIHISPNPANNNLTISFEVINQANVSISLINVSTHSESNLMETSTVYDSFHGNFDITEFERGNYFVVFRENGNQVAKILNKFGD